MVAEIGAGDVPFAQFYTPSIGIFGLTLACYTSVIFGLATARDIGLLKRIQGTPLPMPIYLGSWLTGAVLTGLASVVLMFVVAVPVFGVDIYPRLLPAAIVTLVLGAATLAALGLAVASLVRNADQAMPVAQLTFLPLSFISGIWYPLDGAPGWITTIAHIFPLYHLVNAFDACFVPQTTGNGFAWGHLAVIAAWGVAGLLVAVRRFQAVKPEPRGELEHINPFTLLVAVVLSAQATDAGVNKATPALFAVADTPERMLELGEEKVREYIKTIGLYRNKAKNVIALSEKLIAEFGGEVPRTRAEIETLPGAGRKTANVVLNMAYGEHTMAVDTHVFRVGNRTGLAPGDTPLAVELGLEKVIPPEFMLHAHHWLILHGRYTCLARKPRCEVCLINDLCRWPEKTV